MRERGERSDVQPEPSMYENTASYLASVFLTTAGGALCTGCTHNKSNDVCLGLVCVALMGVSRERCYYSQSYCATI